jgi:Protein of unknown function (DUF2802)
MITIDISTIIGSCALLLSVVALGALAVVNRSLAHWRERCLALEASVPALRREVELMASISVRTGRQVKRIENEYSDVAERVDLVELRGPAKSLGEAIDSARRGAEPAKLTRQFGLSRGEAELVARLHRQPAGA